jgi:hypothetical protein
MEELLIAVISAVAEILLEIVSYLPCDVVLSLAERRRGPDGRYEFPVFGLVAIGVILGSIIGVFSLQFSRQTMLPYAWLRMGNIVVAPVTSGLIARWTAGRRVARGEESSPRHHFAFACAVTMGLVLVRFVHATRPR